ncbi:MAG: cysteine hydrolase family protein [Bacteroidales bacterium]
MNSNTALILIDIQNDYFEGGKNSLEKSREASLNAKKLLDTFRHRSLPIIHIQHHSTRPDATFFIPNTLGAEIHHDVFPIEGEPVIIKNFPNSFRETSLSHLLEAYDVENLVICGMMTHMCVDATVRAAKDFGYHCTVIGDACATKSLECMGHKVDAIEVHHSFLAALSYYYATIKTTEEYMAE